MEDASALISRMYGNRSGLCVWEKRTGRFAAMLFVPTTDLRLWDLELDLLPFALCPLPYLSSLAASFGTTVPSCGQPIHEPLWMLCHAMPYPYPTQPLPLPCLVSIVSMMALASSVIIH